ncbi:hypothetical protein B0T36_04225 [Nocardia donostiensis]|uniref:scabin-related ADP-ribosyltransferase n=1 Tax=Nocardia donostiensis TaxID=1538463 RepID=UPI0009DA2719|nr:hypothetical protein [Nocardia donostiensis]OQS16854.1 hypothetical protein B0T36_04225 [Nocardia donostiensis]
MEVLTRLVDSTHEVTTLLSRRIHGVSRNLDGVATVAPGADGDLASTITASKPMTSRRRPKDPFEAAFRRDIDVSTHGLGQPALWRTDVNVLYRHDNRPPEVIFAEGFQVRNSDSHLGEHEAGTPSGFVSTTRAEIIGKGTSFRRRYIYSIDAPGGIDLGEMAAQRFYSQQWTTQQKEVAFPGGIRPEFIVGARLREPRPGEPAGFIENPNYRPRPSQ